jgi:tetratricopeptide (TPR) repeat protein
MGVFDRDAALLAAEKALRVGRIDAAISEYQRIVEVQPRDWTAGNTLGDLYLRANRVDEAVAQFTRIAEHLGREGFFPKAAALYKKVLKARPRDEHALLQLGDLAARQGLLADAKDAYATVVQLRRSRGETRAAAEVEVRLGRLDPDDIDARLQAAHAAAELGDVGGAIQEYRDIALLLHRRGDTTGALRVLSDVTRLDPGDVHARGWLARGYAAAGEMQRAREYVSPQTAGESAHLWLTLAEIEFRDERLDEGRVAVRTAIRLDPGLGDAAVALSARLADQSVDVAYSCTSAIVEHLVSHAEFEAAAAALEQFSARVPHHLVALMRLVEVSVEGRLDRTLYGAQSMLAAAYLHAGRGLEARLVCEDLLMRNRADTATIERFRQALTMLGVEDPDAVVAEAVSAEPLAPEPLDLGSAVCEHTQVDAAADSASRPVHDGPSPSFEPPALVEPRSLDQVFRDLREEIDSSPSEEAAAEQHTLALTYHDLGMIDEAMDALKQAARSPRQRFEAAAMLARLHVERGEFSAAVEGFERAAEAPPTDPEAGHAVLYDLAETLQRAGEPERALAVFVELEAECRGFRDVSARIERLGMMQAEG